MGIPANEADTLGDRSGEPVDCRDSFAGVHPERDVVAATPSPLTGVNSGAMTPAKDLGTVWIVLGIFAD